MKTELIQTLTGTFEAHAQQTESGVEYWLARDMQHLLGYAEWRNFNSTVVSKAKTACEVSGHAVSDHFVDVNKMVNLGSGSQREVDDLMLTRFACYLIAQNGDSRKQEIAFAQTYFAVQTRRAEVIEQRLLEAERVSARHKLPQTEKDLSGVIYEQTGGNQDFALIRSKGDNALFGKSTQAMKATWKVPASHGRVCPEPTPWNTLWEQLPDRQRAGAGWQPPLPLILGAWWHTSDAEKRDRFELHLRWAHEHGALDGVAAYLNTLEPGDWHTAPAHG